MIHYCNISGSIMASIMLYTVMTIMTIMFQGIDQALHNYKGKYDGTLFTINWWIKIIKSVRKLFF